MSAHQGEANASSASIGAALGHLPKQAQSPNGAALTFLGGRPIGALVVVPRPQELRYLREATRATDRVLQAARCGVRRVPQDTHR